MNNSVKVAPELNACQIMHPSCKHYQENPVMLVLTHFHWEAYRKRVEREICKGILVFSKSVLNPFRTVDIKTCQYCILKLETDAIIS